MEWKWWWHMKERLEGMGSCNTSMKRVLVYTLLLFFFLFHLCANCTSQTCTEWHYKKVYKGIIACLSKMHCTVVAAPKSNVRYVELKDSDVRLLVLVLTYYLAHSYQCLTAVMNRNVI